MAKNASAAGAESRIPVPRTARPSLLPKARCSIGGPVACSPKISGPGHRQQPRSTAKQQFNKTIGFCEPHQLDSSLGKESSLATDYSVPALWTAADNKESDHPMRLNDEQQQRPQDPDLTKYNKKQHHQEDVVSDNLASDDYEITESPTTTTTTPHHYLMLTKQNSFEHDHDESLGILTPDQMTDFTVALDSSRTPSCENLSANSTNKFLQSKSGSEVVAAAARHLDLATRLPPRSVEALSSSLNDRSPSIEELPLDPKPVVIIAEDVEALEASLSGDNKRPGVAPSAAAAPQIPKAIDSSETSETTRSTSVAGPHVLPTSFVTSVTSITSLEAGYQGDGENSRPASRGPEPLSVAAVTKLLVGTARQDPMTDSDFFTESDVDGHEEIVRGDRRAQVIDGTLFCANPHDQRSLSLEPEEMDSSGIYSDFEKRHDGLVGEGDAEGDHTTDTGDTEVSMKSQPSPRDQLPVAALVTQNALTPSQSLFNLTNDLNTTPPTVEVTVIKCQKNEQNTATKSKSNGISNKENSAPLKKYKMPKRNVSSKIKTMIESNKDKEEIESEPKKLQRQQRKNGRWEAVMNKIEAGKQRSRPIKKEIKSRVFDGLSSTQAALSKRRARARPDASNSPNQETARSSIRSSASDLSNALSKEILKRPQQQQQQQQQQPTGQLRKEHPGHAHHQQFITNKSNLTPVRKSTAASNGVIKSGVVHQSGVKQKNNASLPKGVTERNNRVQATKKDAVGEVNHHHNSHHDIFGFNNNNNINNNNSIRRKVSTEEKPAVDTREQESQVDLSMVLEEVDEDDDDDESSHRSSTEFLCDRADRTIQALAITVQYLTDQIDSAKVENANLRRRRASLEDELSRQTKEHRVSLENLHHELSQATLKESSLESKLSEEQCRRVELEKSLADRERQHRETLDRLAAEHEIELNQVRAQAQQPREHGSLLAEIESLRTVLELRSQEYASLRSEADLLRREMDDKEIIRHKYESVQARCEDLQAQLQSKEEVERKLLHEHEVLMGSIHQLSKQTKRLNQKNEELYWRLRQKNETDLRNQLVSHQLASNRLSKSLCTESESEAYRTHHHDDSVNCSSNCSQQSDAYETASSSMIKYMVEKNDSVSWTLDITDDLDGSQSPSHGTSEKNGVKRQNSLRLSNQKRTITPNRSRSSSVTSPTVNDSVRKAAALAAARVAAATKKDANTTPNWSPAYNSTPNPKSLPQRRRTIADAGEPSWNTNQTNRRLSIKKNYS